MEHPHNLEPHHTCQCNYYNTHTHTTHRPQKHQTSVCDLAHIKIYDVGGFTF